MTLRQCKKECQNFSKNKNVSIFFLIFLLFNGGLFTYYLYGSQIGQFLKNVTYCRNTVVTVLQQCRNTVTVTKLLYFTDSTDR